MPRMYAEAEVEPHESPRMAAHRIMQTLDEQAAIAGHRVTGDVTIYEQAQSFSLRPILRLEAEVAPSST